ncbi:MAG TPA: molybdenum cofactor biosynthesis protein MoaE [Longimicrobiaceae bacterium]|nr:molybdenum cofactor biosynthesis protein MoaE [Longimicrobiaceae bacterium]
MAGRSCRVTHEPLDSAAILREVATPSDGAVLLFWGIVRDHNEGREVDHLEYQAYTEMAEAELRRIVTEAATRWETGEIAVVHRLGRLEVGEASVAIAVAAPHRAETYEASRYVIEELKRRVPIWKKEGYLDGAGEWLAGQSPGATPAGSHEA